MNIAMTFPDTVDEFMEQYKMTDTECVYSNGIEYVPIFRMEQWFKHLEAKPKTNGNRIRSMTDEELANKMSGLESFALTCGGGWPPEKWLDWLKEEVKHDNQQI